MNGTELVSGNWYAVTHKWTGETLAEVAEAGPEDIESCAAAARTAIQKPLSVHERYRVLESAAERLAAQREEFALLIAREAGKPLKDARTEVDRAQQTLRYSAVAARTLSGTEVPVRGNPGSEGRFAMTLRKPYGVVLAITPFNFPLNLVLHKVGPALAGGNAVIIKPAPQTPLTALRLAELLEACGLPPGWVNVLTGSGADVGSQLVQHPGVDLISFTGSAAVGTAIRQAAGLKPVLLELGSNSANIVHLDADVDKAATLLAPRAYAYAGQVCISVQRIMVHRSRYDEFSEVFRDRAQRLKIGNPEDETTDIGPMIDARAAERAELWITEAVSQGARSVLAGRRDDAVMSPWLLDRVEPTLKVMAEEIFAPVAVMTPYDHIAEAIDLANRSRYGLQAGIFTSNLDVAFYAANHLQVGGVIVNDTSGYRADNMPYGGIKDSGIGREGPEFAVYEMTYPTTVVLNLGNP